MPKIVRTILEEQGFNCEEYSYIEKTADNISVLHIKSGKKVDIRW